VRQLFRAHIVIPVIAVSVLASCALPSQQLSLPGPVQPEAGPPKIASVNKKAGVSGTTGWQPEASEPRAYPGTGVFTGATEPRRTAAEPRTGEGITLSLSEVSIAEAARVILGETLGLNFVVSEKLKGTITIQTVKPMSREGLLDVFETVLKGEGAGMVVDKGVYNIVPIADAVANAPMLPRGSNARRLAGVGSLIVPLQYVSAPEMERILKSVSPQVNVLRTDTTRNLLVVSGTRSDLDTISDTVSVFDVDWMKGMSFALFPVETADPESIASELDTVFANDKEGPAKGMVRFIPNRRLKSILVISARPEYLRKAEAWMSRIDMVSRAIEKQVHVYHIQNRGAVELAALLQRVYAGQTGRISTSALPTPSSSTPMSSSGTPGGVPWTNSGTAGPMPIPLPGAGAGIAAPIAPGGASVPPGAEAPTAIAALPAGTTEPVRSGPAAEERLPNIQIVPDEANNALVITATAKEYKRLRQILERVDVMPNQVMLEATIAEVKLNDQLKYGIRAFLKIGATQLRFNDSTAGTVTPSFPGFSSFWDVANVQVALNALQTVTDVNIVSSPTLMVLDNKKAVLQVGDEVPISTGTTVANATTITSVAYKSTGIVLNITPRINDQNRVVLDIEQEVSDVTTTTTSGIDSPTIQQRRVRTTVTVNDGESIMLAGLQQDKSTNTRNKTPLASDIPLFGNLFKSKDDTISRTELLIAITPRIVKDARQVRGVTEEFRDKMNYRNRPQRQGPPDAAEQFHRIVR
jgi:general secretion pathway protein D